MTNRASASQATCHLSPGRLHAGRDSARLLPGRKPTDGQPSSPACLTLGSKCAFPRFFPTACASPMLPTSVWAPLQWSTSRSLVSPCARPGRGSAVLPPPAQSEPQNCIGAKAPCLRGLGTPGSTVTGGGRATSSSGGPPAPLGLASASTVQPIGAFPQSDAHVYVKFADRC